MKSENLLWQLLRRIDYSIVENHFELTCFAYNKIKSEKRFYHSWDNHIYPMLQMIEKTPSKYSSEVLVWAALFHDVVYNPKNTGGLNEQLSAELWVIEAKKSKVNSKVINLVEEIIYATYGHESKEPEIIEFLKLDLAGFGAPFYKILENELLIRKEYQSVDWGKYKEGRIEFLTKFSKNSIIQEMGVENKLLEELAHLENVVPNIAIYPGTFNPFHKGHLDILKKAEAIFDKVIIVYAENPEKPFTNINFPEEIKDRQIEVVRGSIIKWIENLSYPVTIIRGLRNTSDVQYEQNYLRWLQELSSKKLRVVNIFCDKENEHISSSALRALALVDHEAVKYFKIK